MIENRGDGCRRVLDQRRGAVRAGEDGRAMIAVLTPLLYTLGPAGIFLVMAVVFAAVTSRSYSSKS